MTLEKSLVIVASRQCRGLAWVVAMHQRAM